MKKCLLVSLLLCMSLLTACARPTGGDMPFGGSVTFHEISITVPQGFVRDSTQSTEDSWLFEKNWYKKMVILVRNDFSDNADAFLNEYAAAMSKYGDSARTEFQGVQAVHSTYTRDGVFCQEIFFIHRGSSYAIALRGGTEEEFQQLLDSLKLQ